MLLRLALFVILAFVVARAFWRLLDGIVDGASGGGRRGSARVPQRGVHMARDPVCGMFVVPERAVMLADGGGRLYFCSEACRDMYRARSA